MVLVILAALCVAGFAITFKYFERFAVPLQAAITVNYLVAFVCGLIMHPPWNAGDTSALWLPSAGLGCLFVAVFSLTGVSAQRAGAARTTIAGRMSLMLTVVATAFIFKEHVSLGTWIGIALSLAGLILTMQRSEHRSGNRSWLLPLIIFLGSGLCDIGVTVAQRSFTTGTTEAAFTTLCFGAAFASSMVLLFLRKTGEELRSSRAWIGGTALGTINYASLFLLVSALGQGAMPASTIFPLMNIGAILFSTFAAILLFREDPSGRQWVGVIVCVLALSIIMGTTA
ncbi:MAG: DMT family transporter [Flavobacteriales bacterium]|nr:DMT family transporter [Flavobacteriales bacterium]